MQNIKSIEANYPGSTQKLLKIPEANLFRIGSEGDMEPSERVNNL